MKPRFLGFLLISFSASFLCFSAASAQVPISIGGLELSASSDNPIPGQIVTITARSYAVDANASKISWTVDGKVVQNALGATTLQVVAPTLGKKMVVNVSAATPEGRVVSASITIGSGSVDMILEADGYVHPFFRGKLSPFYQNAVKIVAMPHLATASGVEYDPQTLVYRWKRNDRALEDQSGYGKQAVTLVGDIVPRPYDVTVTVTPRDGSSSAQGFAEITVGGPSIGFYIDDPLYGPMFNATIGDTVRIGSQKETSVLAVPYGFNKPAGGIGDLSWSWLINGVKRTELVANESVVLRAPEGSAGSSKIQLDIRNTDRILQGASGAFSAAFSATDPNRSAKRTTF